MLELILGCIVVEFLEIYWQKGNSIKELLVYNYQSYNKAPIFYFVKHLGFLYILYIIVGLGLINTFSITILIMKSVDLLFKLKIISKLNEHGEGYIDEVLNNFDARLSTRLKYSNILIYPILLFLALF